MSPLWLLAYRSLQLGDWLAHVTVSAIVQAVIYGFVFRLMHHLTLTQMAVLVAVVLGFLFILSRTRARWGW